MLPGEAMIISLSTSCSTAGSCTNTVLGLTVVYVATVLPFTIWTLRGFVGGVPIELEEAAMIDGCGRLRAFFAVTFPLIAPGLIATGVFAFIQAWNEFVMALVLMNRPDHQTLPVWLRSFNAGQRGTDWGAIMAGSTLMTIPVIVFFLFVQGRMAARPGLRSGEGLTWTTSTPGSRARVLMASFHGTDAARLGRGGGSCRRPRRVCLFGSEHRVAGASSAR